MNRLGILASATALMILAGCGEEKVGSAATDSPRAVADTMISAIGNGDSTLAASLLPPVASVRAAFDCPEDRFAKQIEARAKNTGKELAKMKEAKVTIAIGDFDQEGTSTTTLKEGEEFKGCTAKAPVTVHKSKLTLKISEDGKTKDDGETWTFLKFGDETKWYWMK